jgi:hypothetical protein
MIPVENIDDTGRNKIIKLSHTFICSNKKYEVVI